MLFSSSLFKAITRLKKPTINSYMYKIKKNINTMQHAAKNQNSTTNIINKTFQTLQTPIKSESDQKEYKVIQLANGLIACLISDKNLILESGYASDGSKTEESDMEISSMESDYEDTEDENSDDDNGSLTSDCDENRTKKHRNVRKLAAAALCIGVGSFSDPKRVPGMAHFLEHMVFMGSKKYPKENAFDEFVKLHGGTDNASTDTETTVFYFECLEKSLEEGLDRFSQFFIEPLMKRDAITREREAIESEFQLSKSEDSSRKEQLLCALAKENSPVNGFSWGNLITLRDNINDDELYKRVHEFRKRHYSAHRMTLAVQAGLTLDELEKFVLDSFSGIPNNNLPADDFQTINQADDVFSTPNFNKLFYVVPVKDLCQVDITWAFPSLKNKYRSKPQHYLSHLLGDEGKGSLLSYLKKKCWVISTTAGDGESGMEHNSIYTLFTVCLSLTEDGYSHLDEVIEAVFSYIELLRQLGPSERIFNELQSITNVNFKYVQEETAAELVEGFCESMQQFPPEDFITGSELYFEYDPDAIKFLLELMTPDKANYMIVKTNDDDDDVDKNYETEKWFGTRYMVKNIPEEWSKLWKNVSVNSELSLPPPNEFVTNNFAILSEPCKNPDYPEKILENDLVELWYRQDTTFKLPIAHYHFYLISPLSVKDCKSACMLDMILNLLTMQITEDIYPASTADLSHSFSTYERGLIIKIYGFNEKLPILVNLIAKHLVNLSENIEENIYEAIKDKLKKSYHNNSLKPSAMAKDLRLNILLNNTWNAVERYWTLQEITFDDIKEYSKRFFEALYIKVLVQGNVDQTTAISSVNEFINTINCAILDKVHRPKYGVSRIGKGERCCRIKNLNPNDVNSIIMNYYQSDIYTIENSAILDIIVMAIEEPLFDILRTKEQLGYHVECSVRDTFGVLGYLITVNAQATKATAQHVNERIEAFIKTTEELLKNLTNEEFHEIKLNLIKMKECPDVKLKEEVDRNWSEITSEDYVFNRLNKEIEAIKKTKLETVQKWWSAHNSFGTKENFRKVSIQVEGSAVAAADEDSTVPKEKTVKLDIIFTHNNDEGFRSNYQQENYFIENIIDFKNEVKVFHVK